MNELDREIRTAEASIEMIAAIGDVSDLETAQAHYAFARYMASGRSSDLGHKYAAQWLEKSDDALEFALGYRARWQMDTIKGWRGRHMPDPVEAGLMDTELGELQCTCGNWVPIPGPGEIVECNCGTKFETPAEGLDECPDGATPRDHYMAIETMGYCPWCGKEGG